MDDVEVQELVEQEKMTTAFAKSIGIDPDNWPYTSEEALAAMSVHPREVAKMLLWRLERKDIFGRSMNSVEIGYLSTTFAGVAAAIRSIRGPHQIFEEVSVCAIARDLGANERPDWIGEWNTANPGRNDLASTVLVRGDTIFVPGVWNDVGEACPRCR